MGAVEQQQGKKDDAFKPRFELIDGDALMMLAMVLTSGAVEYGDHNWRYVAKDRIVGATGRHLASIMCGEDWDQKSKLAHGAHLMANGMFLVVKALQEGDLFSDEVRALWRKELEELIREKAKA